MRKIDKKAEPKEWKEYRNTPNARYQSFPYLVDALLDEQGYICAYCERRIPYRDMTGQEDHRIEHLSSQAKSRNEGNDSDLDYQNMVICCPGNIAKDGADCYHCDKKKGDKDLHVSPLNAAIMSTIAYTSTGLVKSTDPQIDAELGREGLNLNTPMLRRNRQEVWLTIVEHLGKVGWTKRHVEDVLSRWEQRHDWLYINRNNEAKTVQAFYPYCSIVIYMLRKKLRQGLLH